MLMKARFFAIAALVLGMASCQRDIAPEANFGGDVDFRLEVSAPDFGVTRADADSQAGHDSAFGAIDYLSDPEWAEVDLRYILEVYDKADDYTNAEPIKDRQVIIVDKYEPVTFETRLAPQRDYHFVVFADFVAQGATNVPTEAAQAEIGLRHNIGATLGDITIKKDAINDELADAYFATLDYNPSHNTHNTAEPIVLRRPYGKVRVVATDLAELNLNVEPRAVRVAYNAYHANAFNAVNGEISGKYVQEFYDYGYAELHKNVAEGGLSQHLYTKGYDAKTAESKTGVVRHTHMTLFTDYILAENTQNTINMVMSVYDVAVENIEGAQPIKTTAFNTEIPVQRNYLTTIIGNVLTTATDIHVSIDDNFYNEVEENPYFVEIWDGVSTLEPEFDAETKSYYIWRPSELAWIAKEVNENGNTLLGINVEQMADLDLNCEYWTPIGPASGHLQAFRGNYNGNGFEIHGLHVDNVEAAGLFGFCSGNIKNVTLVEPWIVTNHYAGGIAGWYQAVDSQAHNRISIDNCQVLGGTITALVDANKDNGDKAGAIAGYTVRANVTNCFVDGVTVTAFRDLGGIVGHANTGSYIANNKIVSSYVVADQTAEYYEAKAANAGEIVGRVAADAVLENNEFGGGANAANYLDVRVVYRANNADNINANSTMIAMLPAGEYEFNTEVTSLGLQLNNGASTLNANDNTLNLGNENNYGVIVSGASSSLVINDANVHSLGGGLSATNGAYVEFNGNALYLDCKSTSARYAIYAVGENSKVVVNGGDFSWNTAKNNKRAYVYCAAGATVEINGGTFAKPSTRSGYTAGFLGDGNIVVKGGTFAFNPTTWVAEGYQAVKDGANWVVSAL